MKGKKGMGLNDLVPIGVAFVLIVLVLTFGASIVGDVERDMVTNSTAENVTNEGLGALSKMGQKLPTLATVVIAGVIVGILMAAFAFRR